MKTYRTVLAVVLALAAGACGHSSDSKSVAPAAAAADSPAPVSSVPASGTREEHIFDAQLNLSAYNVIVPAGWKFDAAYVPGSSCAQMPFPVFRMYSPDGLTEIRRYPRFDWRWSNNRFAPKQASDCLDLKDELSGDDFLKYFMGMTGVAYVRDYPIPTALHDAYQKSIDQTNESLAASARQMDAMNASLPAMRKQPKVQPATQKGALAAAIGQYRNGTFLIEEQILLRLLCTHAPLNFGPGAGTFSESCNATVRVMRAPKGQLDALIARDDKEHFGAQENLEWAQKYLLQMQAQAKARSEQMFRDADAKRQQRQQEFERAQAVRQQQHEQFMQTMAEGTQRSMARTQEAANARQTMTSDWCDYLLDRQTVTGPGGTVKISSAYNHTWTDGSGNYYQTNDPNTDPNGVLKGNWTMTTQTHGDGTAK